MKTPQEKYENDPLYHGLVKRLVAMIHDAQFTPSELREAVIFACIQYEMHNRRDVFVCRAEMRALEELEAFRHNRENQEAKP